MRQLLLLSTFLTAFALSSQNFTNGSVYNYNVGDTIVTASTNFINGFNGPNPPVFTYRMFTNKTFSQAMDTVFYTVKDVVHTICINCPPTITSTVSSFFVTDLTSSVLNFTPQVLACQPLRDTSYVGYCGSNIHRKYAQSTDTCFEPPLINFLFIEGVGKFEEYRVSNSIPKGMGYKTELISFSKTTHKCGTVGVVPNGISEYALKAQQLKVFPNPSESEFNFEMGSDGSFSVQDPLGREIINGPVSRGKNTLDLGIQSSGVYFIKCESEGKWFIAKLVKH